MSEAIVEFGRYRSEAAEVAEQSLKIAVGIPLSLWSLFLLVRWIWTGKFRHSQSLVEEEPSILSKRTVYWSLGIVGCAILFALNVLFLPSGRAAQVIVSAAIQGLGLALVAWVAVKVRDAIQRRSQDKKPAAQPGAATDPPQAADR
jgi:hypothetical protein